MDGLKGEAVLGKPPKIRIKDLRKTDMASNSPITGENRRDVNASPEVMRSIIREANAQGIDPYTALAMAHQESNFDKYETGNPFHVFNVKTDNPIKEGISFLKDKLAYAKTLGKKSEADQIQAWNGYGKLGKVRQDGVSLNKWYGIDVSKNPIDMNVNPVYGKRVIDIRDNILKTNPEVVKMVEEERKNTQQPSMDKSAALNGGLIGAQLIGLK